MTITPPTVAPVTVEPISTVFRGTPDVQPFTYRSGMTYTQLLESIRVWLHNTLVPYLNTNFEDLTDSWLENVTAIDTAVNTALASQADAINTALTTQQQQVADELATTLNEITQGESAALNDSAVFNALQVANSQALALLDGRYWSRTAADGRYLAQADTTWAAVRALRLEGTGIDPTGGADSATAVQAFLGAVPDGATITVPAGVVIKIGSGLTINRRIRLTGGGELRWSGGAGIFITVAADGVFLDGIYLTNPGAAAVGGIAVKANLFRAIGCRVVGMADGIQVAATGEFHDIVISNNLVLDVIGSGLGPSNNTYNGENGGDGIVCWGAAVTITGNRVTCKAGSDARIGIHVESLYTQEVNSYQHADSLATVTGNVVSGQFRRSIVSEGVAHAVIANNSLADATMWGIAVIGLAHHTIVANNTIKWTRTAADTQFSYGTPARSGIYLFCIQEELHDVQVVNNVIRAVAGSNLPFGISLGADASVSAEAAKFVRIVGNLITDESGTMGQGINIAATTRGFRIDDNVIPLFQSMGINVASPSECSVSRNQVNGPGSVNSAIGIKVQGGGENTVDDNRVSNTVTAIQDYFSTTSSRVSNNHIRNSGTGLDFYGSAGIIVSNGNLFSNVSNPRANVPAATFTSVGNSA